MQNDGDAAQRLGRRVEHDQAAIEGDEAGGGQSQRVDINQRGGDAEGGHHFGQGAHAFQSPVPTHHAAEHLLVGGIEAADFVLLAAVGLDDADATEGFLHDDTHGPGFLFLLGSGFADFFADQHHGHDAEREEQHGHQGEFPIQIEQHGQCADDRQRLLHGIADDAGESLLGDARLVHDGLQQIAAFLFIEELLGLAENFRKEIAPDIIQQLQADPDQTIRIQIAKNSPQQHDRGNAGANENHGQQRRHLWSRGRERKAIGESGVGGAGLQRIVGIGFFLPLVFQLGHQIVGPGGAVGALGSRQREQFLKGSLGLGFFTRIHHQMTFGLQHEAELRRKGGRQNQRPEGVHLWSGGGFHQGAVVQGFPEGGVGGHRLRLICRWHLAGFQGGFEFRDFPGFIPNLGRMSVVQTGFFLGREHLPGDMMHGVNQKAIERPIHSPAKEADDEPGAVGFQIGQQLAVGTARRGGKLGGGHFGDLFT